MLFEILIGVSIFVGIVYIGWILGLIVWFFKNLSNKLDRIEEKLT